MIGGPTTTTSYFRDRAASIGAAPGLAASRKYSLFRQSLTRTKLWCFVILREAYINLVCASSSASRWPPVAVDELSKLTTRLRAKEDNLRWTAPETWHVTLQFLGSTDQQQYNCLIPRLREIHLPHIPIRLESTGFFDRAGIFFADVKPAPALLVLQQSVIAATTPCGFVPESRPYHPHITLARAKEKDATPDPPQPENPRRARPKVHFIHGQRVRPLRELHPPHRLPLRDSRAFPLLTAAEWLSLRA